MLVQLISPMGYRRRLNLSKRPINSVKNIVDSTNIGVAAGVTTDVVLGDAVNNYAGAVTEIPIGARVSAVYLFLQIQPQAAQGNVDWYFAKVPRGATFVSMPVPGATGGNPDRKLIYHEEKGIPGTFNNGASPLTFRGVIKIPKMRQRMGEDDRFGVRFRCSTAYDACVKCIYKFYQ